MKWCNEYLMIYVGLQTSGSSMRVVWWSVAGGTVPCGEPTPDDAIPAGSGLDPLLLYYKLVNTHEDYIKNKITFPYKIYKHISYYYRHIACAQRSYFNIYAKVIVNFNDYKYKVQIISKYKPFSPNFLSKLYIFFL